MRNLLADAVVDQIDAPSTTGLGTLRFIDDDSTLICILTFSTTAFGAAATGLATANTITDGNSSLASTVTVATIFSATTLEVLSCSVTSTGGGGDIELSSNVISSGQTISMTALTYTAPT
ncbi:MAG TPA: hypothetical protein ENH62_02310 [Marinobacter sp.]|nr:hypothetical protein [Marinobacter sp.]